MGIAVRIPACGTTSSRMNGSAEAHTASTSVAISASRRTRTPATGNTSETAVGLEPRDLDCLALRQRFGDQHGLQAGPSSSHGA